MELRPSDIKRQRRLREAQNRRHVNRAPQPAEGGEYNRKVELVVNKILSPEEKAALIEEYERENPQAAEEPAPSEESESEESEESEEEEGDESSELEQDAVDTNPKSDGSGYESFRDKYQSMLAKRKEQKRHGPK